MMLSIRARLLGSLLVTIVVLGASASVVTYHRAKSDVNELFDYEMQQMIYSLGLHLSSHPELAQEPLLRVEHDFVTQVWAGETLLLSAHPGEGPDRPLAPGFSTIDKQHGGWRTFTAQAGEYTIQIAQPLVHRRQKAARIAFNVVLPIAAMIPVGGVIIWLGIGYGLQPLRRVTQEVKARDPHSLEPIAFEALPAEVSPLVDSLNDLLRRLDHALQIERQFIADASHELRTPATALGLQIDLVEGASTAEERKESIREMRRGIDRMQQLIEQILILARLDPDNTENPQNIDLGAFLEEILGDFMPLAAAKSIDFALCAPFRLTVRAESASLRALVRNLVDNAICYTSAGGKVAMTLDPAGAGATVKIIDSGPGIPATLRGNVFGRFFRGHGDADKPGTGLGLAIVRRAAERLGVTLQLDDAPEGRGLAVLIHFPIAATAVAGLRKPERQLPLRSERRPGPRLGHATGD